MKNGSRKIKILKFVLIPAAAAAIVVFCHEAWFYWKFIRTGTISITAVDRVSCRLRIPVKYRTGSPEKIKYTIPVSTGESGTFFLDVLSDGKMCFQRTSLEFGGLAVYHVVYEIREENVEKTLRQFLLQNFEKKTF